MGTEVEDIKARLPVVEVVGGYVQLTKAGVSWKGLCPFHREKTPSFVVSEERGSWHCFGCNKGGDIFTFLMEIENITFPEALSLLAERAGVEIVRRERRSDQQYDSPYSHESEEAGKGASKQRLLEAIDLASRFFEKQLWDGMGKRKSLPYLLDRGLSEESIRQFRLGFAPPGWRNLFDFLSARGFSSLEIEGAGLAIRKTGNSEGGTEHERQSALRSQSSTAYYDRFRDRITFPIADALGRVIGFSARVVPGSDESQAKYINTPETNVYHKSKALYGLSEAKRAIREAGEVIFVEGNMDVIAMHQAGFRNTVAVSGTALTDDQLRLMKRYVEKIVFFFDMDSAGQKAARKSAEAALLLGFSVFLVSLSAGKDAADAARDDPDSLRIALSNRVSAPEYFLAASIRLGDIRSPEGRRRIAEDFLRLIALIPYDIDRVHWVSRLSSAIGVEESTLFSLLRSVKHAPQVPDETFSVARMNDTRSSFEKRSDILGENIAAILLANSSVYASISPLFSDRVREFFSYHPILALFDAGQSFQFERIPESLQAEASRLAFQGEALLESMLSEGKEVSEVVVQLIQQNVLLLDEALRHEARQMIEHEMHAARESGNRERERELVLKLVEIGRENKQPTTND